MAGTTQSTGIGKLWASFKQEYRYQRQTAARNHAARQFASMDKAVGKTPAEKAKMDQLAEKVNRLNGEVEATSQNIQQLYREKNADNITKNNGKGRGLGALLGRVISLRSFSAARASGRQSFDSFLDESIREKPAPPESDKTLRQFSDMAKERYNNEIIYAKEAHDKDFFPQFYTDGKYDNAKAVEDMHSDKTNGSKTLGRVSSRVSLAQMYMYSQGCTIEQIYGNTKDCKDLRAKYGKEMMEKLTGSMEGAGKMYADIAKKLNDFPVPDMSSDAALYNNMREINFINKSSINFTQNMGMRDETAVEKEPHSPLEQAFHRHISENDFKKLDKTIQSGQSIHWYGIPDRFDYMVSNEYSANPNKEIAPDLDLSKRTGVVHYADSIETIKQRYKPGTKISDSNVTLQESMEAMVMKSGELSAQGEQKVIQLQSESITNGQVKQIKQQVLNAKPKAKTDDTSRRPYPKEKLFESNNNNVKNRESINQNTKTNEQRKSITPPQSTRESKK